MSAEGECEGEPVDLYIYDLTQGLAAILSPAIMGKFTRREYRGAGAGAGAGCLWFTYSSARTLILLK
ncbi:hypothetical protein MSG28_004399 [Choristoneura fumiferana]|uniref:Uncharacterized protein n=2 Tax=Choristoneura fumiferana TaxID=7141 RepID=A0ACC0KJ95_CHOFU|nr:hypothetical protein MSG28_004399 [Choristoneura fumiferana]